MAIDGDTAVITAPYDDDNGTDSGSAYVFQKPPGGWVNMTETAKLLASDGAAGDRFGMSVALSGDTAVIGADLRDDNGGTDSGSAYVFGPTENQPPVCDAGGPYSAECEGATMAIPLDGTGSYDPDPEDLLSYLWSTDCPGGWFDDPSSPTPVLTVDSVAPCPLVCNVTLTVTDDAGASDTCATTVTVEDTTPPVVTCSVATDVLWSPNHHLDSVGLTTTVSDDCDPAGAAESLIIEVWSDETEIPDIGDGTGRHAPDAKDLYTGLRLRKERRGAEDGRVYLIIARAEDGCGNVGFGYCAVVVPHDQSEDGLAEVAAQAEATLATVASTPGTTIAEKVAPLGYTQHGVSEELGPHQ